MGRVVHTMNDILHYLLNDPYWLSTQGIVQNSTIIFWTLAVIAYWHNTCKATPYCWRKGVHPVEGTAVHVCTKHHTLHDHEAVFAAHDRTGDDNDKLYHGQSHDQANT